MTARFGLSLYWHATQPDSVANFPKFFLIPVPTRNKKTAITFWRSPIFHKLWGFVVLQLITLFFCSVAADNSLLLRCNEEKFTQTEQCSKFMYTISLCCISSIMCQTYMAFLIIKPTRCNDFSDLFLEWNSTCFGQFLCPSLVVFHCTCMSYSLLQTHNCLQRSLALATFYRS
jgi:hypothetical protein